MEVLLLLSLILQIHLRPSLEWALPWWINSWSLSWRVQVWRISSWWVGFSYINWPGHYFYTCLFHVQWSLGYWNPSVPKTTALSQRLGSKVTWKRQGGWGHILKVEFKERLKSEVFGLISDWKYETIICIFHSKWSIVNEPRFYQRHISGPWDLRGLIMGDAASFGSLA